MRHVCDTKDGVKDLAQLQDVCTQRIESWLVFKQDLSRAYRNRAWAYWKQKKNGLARSDFTKAIETNSQDAEAYWLRGVFISGSMTRKSTTADIKLIAAKGIADFTRAIEADPNHLNAYMSRGRTHSFLKDYDKAIADF